MAEISTAGIPEPDGDFGIWGVKNNRKVVQLIEGHNDHDGKIATNAADIARLTEGVIPELTDAGIAAVLGTDGTASQAAVTAQIGALKAWAKDVDNLIAGAITYTAGLVSSAVVEWPDGKPGVLTITARQAGTDAVTAYNVTHVDGGTTRTYTQPTITRDSSGAATLVPQITVA